jgi:polyribonucleotide nucleotidyltransferase
MTSFKIDPDKIREVIGKGGSVIQKIVAESGAKVDITDDGTICIASANGENAAKAKAMIDAIVFEPEVGATYNGTVVKILASKDKPGEDIGCFVEYAPGKEGMVHISKITNTRINKVTDAGIDVGSSVKVKFMGLDKKGRMDFSIKDAD